MKPISFRVYRYRNILDSGEISLKNHLMCVVGRNQSGKTSLLKALHKFNPHEPDPYDIRRDWPRGDRRNRDPNQVVCVVRFILDETEEAELSAIAGTTLEIDEIIISRDYNGNFDFYFPTKQDPFPSGLDPDQVEAICENLPTCGEPASERFVKEGEKCKEEAKRRLSAGRFVDLSNLQNKHQEQLRKKLSPANKKEEVLNETTFLNRYLRQLVQLSSALKSERSPKQKARDYLLTRLPSFIYMDDYIQFKGTADLVKVAEQYKLNKLTPADKTFLMLLELAGLNLESLINQGKSHHPDDIRERQLDLEDGARTLTNLVSARWGQNRYRIQFRVDGQTFLTEIEEVTSDVGMISLEEQSNGFRWFFSFDLRFMHDSQGAFDGCVLLLDEPGIHLHPSGQKDLLKRLDAYAESSTLIYTTHLPYLIDLDNPSRVRIMILSEDGTATVSTDFASGQPEDRLTLQAAIATTLHSHCLLAERNLVVGGLSDFWIITELSTLLERKSGTGLPEDIRIIPMDMPAAVTTTAMTIGGEGQMAVALFNGDKMGKEEKTRMESAWLPLFEEPKVTMQSVDDLAEQSDVATIEDLFEESYYVQLVNEAHTQALMEFGIKKVDLSGVSAKLPVVVRAKRALSTCDIEFNKNKVDTLLHRDLRRTERWDKVTGLKKNIARKFIENLSGLFD